MKIIKFFVCVSMLVNISIQASWQEALGKHMRDEKIDIPDSPSSMAQFLQDGLPVQRDSEDSTVAQVRQAFAKMPTLERSDSKKALKDAQNGLWWARSWVGGVITNRFLGEQTVTKTLEEDAKRQAS